MAGRAWWFALVVVSACGGPQRPPQPADSSQAQHEDDAKRSDAAASEHEGRVDPSAVRTRYSCVRARGAEGACWTWETNPTERHLTHAEELREAAAAHRAAGAALGGAESRACAGVSDVDRDMSPFDHREDVVAVAPASPGRGTTVVLRAVPGLERAYLRKVVDCHLARNGALGFAMPEMAFCPLAVKGASATVEPDPRGLAVILRAADAPTLAEIERRAVALLDPPAG